MIKHRDDYETANMDPWDFPNAGQPTQAMIAKQEKQNRTGYTTNAASHMWFVNDLEHPYNEVKRFDWMRGYHVGGRSLQWGRHSYRWSDIDFKANLNDGHGVDWPVRYKDIAPWYDKVESYIGVTGETLGLPQLPDGQFEPALELNCVEQHVREKVAENFDGRVMTSGRVAHINSDKQFDGDGRTRCQYRNRCSLSSTLPAAEATGNMTLRPDSVVHEVIYDPNTKKATGVKVIDRLTKETYEFKAKVIFLCASAVASTSILMQSKSDRFPNGMGNDSDQLGRNIMDHHLGVGASGSETSVEKPIELSTNVVLVIKVVLEEEIGKNQSPSFRMAKILKRQFSNQVGGLLEWVASGKFCHIKITASHWITINWINGGYQQ